MELPQIVNRHSNEKKPPNILPRESKGPSLEPFSLQPRHKIERGRKNVSRACQACRQRRIRCTTERPCRPCQVNGVNCLDDCGPDSVDLRTTRPGPQNQKAFLQRKTLLDSLLRSIRTGTAEDVIQCIKDGGSLGEIALALRSADSVSELAQTPSDKSQRFNTGSQKESEPSDEVTTPAYNVNYQRVVKGAETFGNLPLSSAIKTNGLSPKIQDRQVMHMSRPLWECAPLICEDASSDDVFSRSCLSFRNMAREQLANGASPEVILSLNGVDMDLLFRNRTADDPHTVSTWACELLKTFEFINPVAKLAGAEGVACLMRWLIAPTKENYLALPEASRPTESQLFVPHSIGVDIFMFPEIRNVLLARGNPESWTNNITSTTMEMNWPYSIDACLEIVPVSDKGNSLCMRLSTAFVEHVRDPNNVSFDRDVLKQFPELEGKFKWHTSIPKGNSVSLVGEDARHGR